MTPAEQFANTVMRLNGTFDSFVLEAEIARLCDKFEFLWGTSGQEEKEQLSSTMSETIRQIADQIATQTTSVAVEVQTAATVKSFNTLKKANPAFVAKGGLAAVFNLKKFTISRLADQQLNFPARTALTRAADTMELLASACK